MKSGKMLILIRLIIPQNEKQHFGCRILNDAVEIRYYDNQGINHNNHNYPINDNLSATFLDQTMIIFLHFVSVEARRHGLHNVDVLLPAADAQPDLLRTGGRRRD